MTTATQTKFVDQTQTVNLRDCVKDNFRKYIASLAGQEPQNVYELFVSEMEIPLIEMMLKRNRGNESETARQLGIARGTLRTRRKVYSINRRPRD